MKKARKKLKKENKKPETYSQNEMKRYLGSLNEMHGESLKGIREGFIPINRKLDNVTEILAQHTEKLDSHTEILAQHTEKLDNHTEMIGVLMEDVSVLKEDVSIIKDDISVMKTDLKRKVDYDEFASLVKRVSKLESKSNL